MPIFVAYDDECGCECDADGWCVDDPGAALTQSEYDALNDRVEYWKTQKALGLPVSVDVLFETLDELLAVALVEG